MTAPHAEGATHALTEYGTTNCPVEGVRASVDDGECSACGAHVAGSGASPARDGDTRAAEIAADVARPDSGHSPVLDRVVASVPWLLSEVERLRADNAELLDTQDNLVAANRAAVAALNRVRALSKAWRADGFEMEADQLDAAAADVPEAVAAGETE